MSQESWFASSANNTVLEKQLSLTSLVGESPKEADSINLKLCPFHMFILMPLQLWASWSNTDTKDFIERLRVFFHCL